MVTLEQNTELSEKNMGEGRGKPQRISSIQLKAMKDRDTKPSSFVDVILRSLNSFWTTVSSSFGYMFANKLSKKKSFCELNGHSVRMVNGTVTNRCRYCEAEINSIDMLTSR